MGQSSQRQKDHGRCVQEIGGFKCGALGTLANKKVALCINSAGCADITKGSVASKMAAPWQTWQTLHWPQSLWSLTSVYANISDP